MLDTFIIPYYYYYNTGIRLFIFVIKDFRAIILVILVFALYYTFQALHVNWNVAGPSHLP